MKLKRLDMNANAKASFYSKYEKYENESSYSEVASNKENSHHNNFANHAKDKMRSYVPFFYSSTAC
jgi:hypothetical protein